MSRIWQEHKIEEENENGVVTQSTIRLPSQPSGIVVSFLTGICAEIHRSGGHTIQRKIIFNLTYKIMENLFPVLENLLFSQDGMVTVSVSTNCYIQLLFDVMFLMDVLLGDGMQEIPITPEVVTPSKTMHLRSTDILNALRGKIDPFDLEVFEPFLKENRSKSYQRAGVMLGLLTQVHPGTHSGTRAVLLSSDNHTALPVAPVPARFPLLPSGTAVSTMASQHNVPLLALDQGLLSVFEQIGYNAAFPRNAIRHVIIS